MENNVIKPFTTWRVGDREYKLKLKISEIERLERNYQIGNIANPMINVSNGQMPSTTYMLDVIDGAMKKFEHGITRAKVNDIYEEYIENGGSNFGLVKVIMDIFKVSGFFPSEENPMEVE